MSKSADRSAMEQEFEHPFVEQDSSRSFGLLLTIALLSIVGIAIWFVVTHESS